jgi:hypothetical protein
VKMPSRVNGEPSKRAFHRAWLRYKGFKKPIQRLSDRSDTCFFMLKVYFLPC